MGKILQKLVHAPLLVKLAFAAMLGVAFGFVLPHDGMRVLTTVQALFSQFVKFLVPLIILGFVTPAIADTGKGAGKALLITMALAYASTLFAGYFTYGLSASIFPSLMGGAAKSPPPMRPGRSRFSSI